MRIAMVSLDYPPTVGGIAAHVYELSKAMASLGHTVTVFTRQRSDAAAVRPLVSNVNIEEFRLRFMAPIYGLQINAFIKKRLTDVTPDVIHIHGMAPLEWYSIKSVPLAYTNHTSGYLRRIRKGGLRRMTVLKWLLRKPQLFLAPSRELLEVPFDIPARKEFIPNGVDANKYLQRSDKRNEIRGAMGFAEDDIIGILTRRLVDKNGVVYLARAAGMLDNPKIRLLFVGDGPERSAIESELQQNFAGRYTMLGAKTHDQIIPLYSAADFSVLPSLMEATSISGLEAMSASLPLVGTHVGGIPELIADGENGYLCKPADAMDLAQKINLLTSGDLQPLGAKSRTIVERRFDWPKIAQKTLDAYRSLL